MHQISSYSQRSILEKCHWFKIITSDKFWLAVIVFVFAEGLKKEMAHRMLRWEKNILRSVVYWSGKLTDHSMIESLNVVDFIFWVVHRHYLFSLYSLCFVFNGKDESWPTQSLWCWNDWFCVWECSCKYFSWGFPIKH